MTKLEKKITRELYLEQQWYCDNYNITLQQYTNNLQGMCIWLFNKQYWVLFHRCPNCLSVVFWSVGFIRLLRALYRVKDDFYRRILKIIVCLIVQIRIYDETYQSSIIWFEANIKKFKLHNLCLYMMSSKITLKSASGITWILYK